ncbi:sphingomyelin phosphodiesterase [Roridomyces roridus]|uniref:Sphingomyelin phosphodiesterase n=1 Tax=Roridomyces roridus TaxID=1738132 RepID=A0AAD7BZQ2_9AGAR|nr:sphingomyelin phosphodiesterase [Roridomyces roridus]
MHLIAHLILLLPSALALNPETIVNALKNAPSQRVAELGDAAFVKTLTSACTVFKLEDDDVCVGAIGEQGPILAHALRNISPLGSTATKLCEGTFGLCQPPPVNEWSVPFPPPPVSSDSESIPTTERVKSSGKTPFQVVHFSDVHIDREYVPGSDANCKKPICCRNFADEQMPPSEPAGPFGNRNCDSPAGLAKSMLEQIAGHHTWSIFTGDVVEAAVWIVNKSEVTNDVTIFNSELSAALNAPVFPAIGNHDAAPVNNFPRDATVSSQFDAQWVFDLEGKEWEHWTNTTASTEETHESGSYAVIVSGTQLRIISVNTVYWYKQNFWVYDSNTPEPDPRGIFAFMVRQLQAAEDAGQRVWIIGHMPPGCQDALSDQSNYYDQIVQRYKDVIAGQFFGHTHYDEFEIAYSDYKDRSENTAVGVAWIAPALTPRSGNPAFKVYDVDPDTYEIMDAKVYMTDLKSPVYQVKPEWQLLYSAREEYGPLVDLAPGSPLDAGFWHRVTEAFERNETAFQRWNAFMTREGDVRTCTGECKKLAVCQMRAMRAEDNCHIARPTSTFGDTERDDLAQAVLSSSPNKSGHRRDVNQCEGAGIGHILSKLSYKMSVGHAKDEVTKTFKGRLDDIFASHHQREKADL